MNNTILQKIGITDMIVQSWLKEGLKISYPMLKNKKYYRSEDGFAFVENGDKYVIPLSKKETDLYTKHPENFKINFLKNVKFYVEFINWLHNLQPKTESLESEQKFTSLLLILYLFQRGMDYHYYHFDRYLVYQNYPDTPVGFWWDKLKKMCKEITVKEKGDENIALLHLLSNDSESKNLKSSLIYKQQTELVEILKNIKIFEDAQEDEIKFVTDFKAKENIFFRTAMPIWNNLMKLLKKYPDLLKLKCKNKIPKITEGHPLIITRLILSPEGLNYFQQDIFNMFENEIKRWI
ncbi:hypothetical protein HZA75_03455 [Candidatus Roizmanbacteria bacterium]|nr:hypothetical protein [Candidatus Roizmanbacteria bacterium]